MKLSAILTPLSDHNLRIASQVGYTDVVSTFPGYNRDDLLRLRDRIDSFGLKLSVIERLVPHDKLVHRLPGWEEQLDGYKTLIGNMGAAGVSTLCYNWMPSDDWCRTSVDTAERGGALVTAFDIDDFNKKPPVITPADELWKNLGEFLREVVPVAEDAGVALAIHPDDPPMSPVLGQPQIMTSSQALARVAGLVESTANGICLCQGSLASAGEDVVAAIHKLAPFIKFVHFRNVVGTVPRFRESFQDNGDIDMVAAMQAYHDIGFTGPIRPDHVPTLDGETNEHPGYETWGRLYAAGYMLGLMQAAQKQT